MLQTYENEDQIDFYKRLLVWNKQISTGKTRFDLGEQRLTGKIAKKASKEQMFQKTPFPKRYFVLDFERGVLYIKKAKTDPDEHGDTKTIYLKNILRTSLPD